MSSTEIRSATESDRASVLELASKFATSYEVEAGAFQSSFKSVLSANDALLVVAEYQGKVVGYCLAFDHPTFFANGKVTWIEEIMVEETMRRKGVGMLLMASAESWVMERGSQLVALATRRASSFYVAVGYEESAAYFRKLL